MFFAAWPAPEVQRALGEIAQQAGVECGGRAVPAHNIHLTLLFIGDVARERVTALESLGAGTAAPAFELTLDRLQYWRHNRILWAGAQECPEALLVLVKRLRESAAPAGFRVDERPYVPHVTLRREARCAPANARIRVDWPVNDLALVESVARGRGRVYEVLRRWPLAT